MTKAQKIVVIRIIVFVALLASGMGAAAAVLTISHLLFHTAAPTFFLCLVWPLAIYGFDALWETAEKCIRQAALEMWLESKLGK